jgi:hypothetical protein
MCQKWGYYEHACDLLFQLQEQNKEMCNKYTIYVAFVK